MYAAKLRTVGGSVMLAVPKALLAGLGLHANSAVGVSVSEGRLFVEPMKPRYTLAELLADCDFSQPMTAEEREWLDAPPIGKEVI